MRKSQVPRPEKDSNARRTRRQIAPYAALSLVSFIAALFLILLLLRHARLLVSLGLEGRFFYLTLLPLALTVTCFLFGIFRSVAIYHGQQAGGALELGGPIVGFALVVIGGFYLPAAASNFPLTVYVHGPGGQQDIPKAIQGVVLLDVGGDRRSEPIGEKGQAFFPEIPANLRGQTVNVSVDAPAYERRTNGPLKLGKTSLYVEVRRKPSHIMGDVLDEKGNFVLGATVSVAGMSTTSGAQGRFDLTVRSDRVEEGMVLRIHQDGYEPWTQAVTLNGGRITAVLLR